MSSRHSALRALLVILVASAMLLSSCNTGGLPTRLYVLMPMTQVESTPQAPGTRGVSIGVGPVELPQYLNRPQIVTGHNASELQNAAVAEWAEPLPNGFTRVLAENLSLLLATDRVAIFPWKSFVPEYQVVIEVTRFLGQTGGEVSLVALWSILKKHGTDALVSKKSSFREPTGAAEYEALAAAMSRTIAALSRDIAAAVVALP